MDYTIDYQKHVEIINDLKEEHEKEMEKYIDDYEENERQIEHLESSIKEIKKIVFAGVTSDMKISSLKRMLQNV